jgi:hypothetical protein
MFTHLESSQEIQKAQKILEKTLRSQLKQRKTKNIGYPGGTTYDATVYTDGEYWFHTTDHKSKDVLTPRRLNWFGLYRDELDLQISVEMNVAYEGRKDRVAGFFARDNDSGQIYLMHSGRVGGGTKGVGKTAFLAWGDLRPVDVFDGKGEVRSGVVVMPVNGNAAVRPLVRYLKSIVQFKLDVRAGKLETPEFKLKEKLLSEFYKESRGHRKGKRKANFDYISRHGEVVDVLNEWRKGKPLPSGGRIIKTVLIDLGVAVGSKLVEVFEVKTSSARQDIYTAIGQLLVHGDNSTCSRVLVVPASEELGEDLASAISRLGIEVIEFTLKKDKIVIT